MILVAVSISKVVFSTHVCSILPTFRCTVLDNRQTTQYHT